MIRLMREEDLADVIKLEQDSFTSCWNEEAFRYELHENPFSHAFVAEKDGKIIGYIVYWITFETAQLCKIAVSLSQRRMGVAASLMKLMMDDAEKQQCEFVTLEVRVSNAAAISLYESFGFIQAGIRKAYYQDNGEDAYIYACSLGGRA